MARASKQHKGKGVRDDLARERLRAQVAQLTSEVSRLVSQLRDLVREVAEDEPAHPPPEADGNYPAVETARAILAEKIVRSRKAAGWTQAQLAQRAGIRQETVSRLEGGKHAPNVATVEKIVRALKRVGVNC